MFLNLTVLVFGGIIHKSEILQALVTVQVQEREALRHLVVQHNAFDLARRINSSRMILFQGTWCDTSITPRQAAA